MCGSQLKLFSPREEHPSVFEIDYGELWRKGIRSLILDLDNTLCPWRATSLNGKTEELLSSLKGKGFSLCILSNGRLDRRHGILREMEQLGIPVIFPARKPLPFGFRKALKTLGVRKGEAAVIGDQLLTDILGGNLLGIYTILVEPVSPHEHPFTRLVSRKLEKLLGRRVRR